MTKGAGCFHPVGREAPRLCCVGGCHAAPILIAGTLIGAYIGKNIVDKIPKDKFRTVIGIFLFLIAIKMIIWP